MYTQLTILLLLSACVTQSHAASPWNWTKFVSGVNKAAQIMDQGIKSPAAQELLEPLAALYTALHDVYVHLMTLIIITLFFMMAILVFLVTQVLGVRSTVARLEKRLSVNAPTANHIKTD